MGSLRSRYLLILLASMLALAIIPLSGRAAMANPEASTLEKVTKRGELRVGWSDWFPFLYRDPKTQQLTGFTVDLYQHMAKVLNVKLVWVENPWGTMPAGLQADKFDVISNANRTSARLLVAEYVGPITSTSKALMTTKAKVGRYNKWQDADNPKTSICTGQGTATDVEMTRVFTKANLMRPEGNPACIAAVAAGRADIYADDVGNLIALMNEQPNFAVVPNSNFSKAEMGIYVRQGDQIMVNWLNWFIRDIKQQGLVDQWLQKYKIEGVEVAW